MPSLSRLASRFFPFCILAWGTAEQMITSTMPPVAVMLGAQTLSFVQGNGCVEDEIVNGGDPTDSNDASVPHIGALALQPRLSAAAEVCNHSSACTALQMSHAARKNSHNSSHNHFALQHVEPELERSERPCWPSCRKVTSLLFYPHYLAGLHFFLSCHEKLQLFVCIGAG